VLAGLLLSLAAGLALAGSAAVIIGHDELLSVMLPERGSVTRYQVSVDESLRDWVDKHYHFRPEQKTVTVWLSRDPVSGQVVGGMLQQDVYYQQQRVSVVIGLSDELRVSRAAIIAVPPSLRQEFEASIGVGYLKRYTMMAARQLRYLANVMKKEGPATALVAEELFRSGAILAGIIKMSGNDPACRCAR
jgi:hypothetical protein